LLFNATCQPKQGSFEEPPTMKQLPHSAKEMRSSSSTLRASHRHDRAGKHPGSPPFPILEHRANWPAANQPRPGRRCEPDTAAETLAARGCVALRDLVALRKTQCGSVTLGGRGSKCCFPRHWQRSAALACPISSHAALCSVEQRRQTQSAGAVPHRRASAPPLPPPPLFPGKDGGAAAQVVIRPATP
jgi:hypothetical protein